MNKPSRIRLSLHRTTLKRLEARDLERAAGGRLRLGVSEDIATDCTEVSNRLGVMCGGSTNIQSAACGIVVVSARC